MLAQQKRSELELPERCYITPSKPDPWRGSKAPGARFTHAQLRRMAELALEPDAVEIVVVFSPVTIREYYWAEGVPRPVYAINCPVIGKHGGRLRVFAPNGETKLVWPDGSITKRGKSRA